MGAIVNRDLQQRIRPINGLTLHQFVTKTDVKNAAKIVQNFDNRWRMWDDNDNDNQQVDYVMVSTGSYVCRWSHIHQVSPVG